MTSRFKYSRWDGTQVGFDLDADALLEEMTDDLLYHGDLNAAMRRMMQQGFQDREGRDVSGMREMLEQLREQRREQLDRYDLGGVYEDIANQLDEIVDQEREGIDRRVDEAAAVGRQAPRRAPRGSRAGAARSSSSSCRPISPGRVERAPGIRLDGRRRAPALRRADGGAEEAAPRLDVQPAAAGHVGDVARAARAHEGHARRAQPDARAARARRGARLRRASWTASATSSPATRRRSTSCSSRWRSRWRRCSSCSTR